MIRAVITLLALCISFAAAHSQQISPQDSSPTKRSVLNINLYEFSEYEYINFFRKGQNSSSPFGAAFATGVQWNSAILDHNGYPNNAANGRKFGAVVIIPASSNFAGPYCVQGKGSGTLSLPLPVRESSWTIVSDAICAGFSTTQTCDKNYSAVNMQTWRFKDETLSGWCLALKYSGPHALISGYFSNTDPNGSGAYIRDIAFYEQQDGADFAAGKIFRAAYKKPIVDLDPGALRFMNWGPGNLSSPEMRFENRATPRNEVGYSGIVTLWAPYLPYGTTAGTNLMTLAATAGTPAKMEHGETLWLRVGHASTLGPPPNGSNENGGHVVISAITIPSPGMVQVTTKGAHGLVNGDTAVIIAGPGTPSRLQYYYAPNVTVIDAEDFSFNFNTAGLSGCGSNCGTVSEGYTLNVGGRGAYPVVMAIGNLPYPYYGPTFAAGDYYRFCFNKLDAAQTDGMGNWVYGAWVICGSSNAGTIGASSTPLEIETALVNELNAMGPAHPINMWITTPHMGLICSAFYSDPDCTADSDYPANMVKVILNGANGYAGLCRQCLLFVEDTNETWNNNAAGNWFGWFGHVYCGEAGTKDFQTYSTLHSMLVMNDIQTSPYANSRIRYILAGQAVAGSGGLNKNRITGIGSNYSQCHPTSPAGSAAPITLYNYFAVAPYMNVSAAFENTNLKSYAAQWASDKARYGASSSQVADDIALWVKGVQSDTSYRHDSTIDDLEADMTSLGKLLATYGKTAINYEGGWNQRLLPPATITGISCYSGIVSVTAPGNRFSAGEMIEISDVRPADYNGFHQVDRTGNIFTYSVPSCPPPPTTLGTTTSETNAYLYAVMKSQAWADAQVGFFKFFLSNPNLALPAVYTELGTTWGFAWPDTFGLLNGVPTEGAGLYPAWTAMSKFNQAQQNFLLKRDIDPASRDDTPMWLNEAA